MSRFDSFDISNEENVKDLISKSSKKSCSLDPMPTSLVLKCQDILLPVITRMINLSLQSGVFCDEWKQALVQPQLKTETVFENIRPISNLTFTSKLTECAVLYKSPLEFIPILSKGTIGLSQVSYYGDGLTMC